MECLANCDIIIDIDLIDSITGGNEYFEISFSTKEKGKHKMVFDSVWDMRYSIENASIARFSEFRKCLPEDLIDNSIYTVENSKYIEYFEHQVSGTRSVDKLKHYVLYDNVDTTLDVLTVKKPILVKL
jgi:hypothetical protein